MNTIALPSSSFTKATRASRVIGIAGALVSFETIFVLFLFAGQYKSDPRFDFLPCDATILFGLINVVQGLLLLCDRRFSLNPCGVSVVGAGSAFAFYTIASTFWASGVEYAHYKAAYICTINLWCLAAAALVLTASPLRFRRFLQALLVFAGWISVENLLSYAHLAQFGRVMQLHAMGGEAAYIGLGRVVTWGAVICAVLWLFGRPSLWHLWQSRHISITLLGFFTATAALIGARGPMVAAALAVGMVAFLFPGQRAFAGFLKNTQRVAWIALSCGLASFAHKLWTGEYPLLVLRFLAFSSKSEYYDVSGSGLLRLEMYSEAFWAWWERPLFGHGVGGFSVVWANLDERLFPHNLVLELLCELGIVGFALFLFIPAAAILARRGEWRQTSLVYRAMVFALAGSAFANTMTSGDLPDNRYFFAALGLLAFRNPAIRPAAQVAPPVNQSNPRQDRTRRQSDVAYSRQFS